MKIEKNSKGRAGIIGLMTAVAIIVSASCSVSAVSAEDRFCANGDGTVTDIDAGLMWAMSVPALKMTFSDAQSYAQNSSLGGYTDWRLPKKTEMQQLGEAGSLSVFDYKKGEYLTCSKSAQHSGAICVATVNSENKPVIINDEGNKRFRFYVWLVRDLK